MKPIVFMFKNQTDFKKDQTIDIEMLKISIKQWSKNYKTDKMIICGSYNNKEIQDIVDILTETFILERGIKILNIGEFPKGLVNKTQKVNYQAIFAWDYLKEEYIVAYGDVFPIQKIDDSYLNKEYGIKYDDYTKIPENKMYWWLENNINAIKYLSEMYNVELKTIYEGHTFYTVDEEVINLLKNDPFLFMNVDRDIIKQKLEIIKGKDILIPDFIGTTFIANKWVWDESKEEQYKGIDVTLPKHPKSQELLKRLKIK